MSTDTAVCETCGTSSYDNEDPVTGEFWCHTCDTWCFFKWPKTGERLIRRPAKPRRVCVHEWEQTVGGVQCKRCGTSRP